MEFKVVKRSPLTVHGLYEVTVTESQNCESEEKNYVLAQRGETSVAFPLATGDDPECLPVSEVPRLFLGFPLIGTEDFCFPAVINSFDFTPTPNRDGVYVARNQTNNEANDKNQSAIETACELLISLLKFSSSSSWRSIYHITDIPAIPEKYWLNHDWLRECIERSLIQKFRETPTILNDSGDVVSAGDVELPVAETSEGIESLYDLLDGWRERRENMPSRSESVGWACSAKSWAAISACDVYSLDGVTDGLKLAAQVEGVSHDPAASTPTYRLSRLQDSLDEDVLAVEWLDQLHGFLLKNGLGEVIWDKRIVPSQMGFLRTLPKLNKDKDIDDELKDIAELMDGYQEWKIKRELRDSRLTFVAEEPGKGEWDNAYVVEELIKKLRAQSEEVPDESFAKASIRLFAWISDQGKWHLLRDFPVYAETSPSEVRRRVIKLEPEPDSEVRTLAPVKAWGTSLQPFSELFPRRHIISGDFFEAVPNQEIWLTLDEEGLFSRDVIINKDVYVDAFYPNEPLTEEDHETSEHVAVTDIAFLSRDEIGITARVRQSRRLARLFWRFLTEWMIVHDSMGLDTNRALCDCGECHSYYPAGWLVPVQRNRWVPLGSDKRGPVTAQSLADLLRGSGWEPGSLEENPAAVKLLEAIGITRFDLVRAFLAANDEERRDQESILTGILDAAAGDTDSLRNVRQYMEDLKDDDSLPAVLKERREQRQRVHENQGLGKLVEGLVKESLENEGFVVQRKPIGSDFLIEHDVLENDEELGIEVSSKDRTWLVEVKATRDQRVRMTEKQAHTAREEGERFLLCVVQLQAGDTDPNLEHVRTNMRFVQNIGPLVAPLCDDIDSLNGLRDNITSGDVAGIQLEVVAGTTRVRVDNSVWQDEGFPIKELLDRLLKPTES